MTVYTDLVLADGAIGFWPLREGSGTVADDPANSAGDGTYTGTGIAYGAAGPGVGLPEAITTSGTGSVSFPNLSGTAAGGNNQPQTWELWANLASSITSASATYRLWGYVSTTQVWPMFLGSATGFISNET